MRILLAFLLCTCCACQAEHSSEDEWIDPLDLFAHDPTMIERDYNKFKEQKERVSKESAVDDNPAKDGYLRSDHNSDDGECLPGPMPCVNHFQPLGALCVCSCHKEKATARHLEDEVKSLEKSLSKKPADHGPFFKQYVAGFLRQLEQAQQVSHLESSHFVLDVAVSEADAEALQRFATGTEERGVQNAHAVLGGMYRRVRQVDIPEGAVVDWSSWLVTVSWVLTAVMSSAIAVNVSWRFGIPWGRLLRWVFVLLFLVSIPWNWWRLYKEEIVKRMASMTKERPPECHPESMTIWQSFWASASLTDQCEKFYASLHIDPWMDVTPTKALVVTVTKMFLDPLQYLGEAISKMVVSCLKDLPYHLWPVALGILLVVCIMLLIMFFGYRINLFYVIDLSPTRQTVPAVDGRVNEQLQVLTQQVQQLTEGNGMLQVMFTEQRRVLDEQLGQPQLLALPSIRPGELQPAPPSYPGYGGYPPGVALPSIRPGELQPAPPSYPGYGGYPPGVALPAPAHPGYPRERPCKHPPRQPHPGAGDQPASYRSLQYADVPDGEVVKKIEVEEPQPVRKNIQTVPVIQEAQSTSPDPEGNEEEEGQKVESTEVTRGESTCDMDGDKQDSMDMTASEWEKTDEVSSMTPDESICSSSLTKPPAKGPSCTTEPGDTSGPYNPDLVTSTTDSQPSLLPLSLHSSFDFLVQSTSRPFTDPEVFDAKHFDTIGSTVADAPPKQLKPAESSDDSDLEIIEEEPDKIRQL